MKIKTIIKGKEIIGNWNGKIYTNREGISKVYINGKEYIVDKNNFKYEEVFTEKQIAYAEDLKKDLLNRIERRVNRWIKRGRITEEDKGKILAHFEKINATDLLNVKKKHKIEDEVLKLIDDVIVNKKVDL